MAVAGDWEAVDLAWFGIPLAHRGLAANIAVAQMHARKVRTVRGLSRVLNPSAQPYAN